MTVLKLKHALLTGWCDCVEIETGAVDRVV